jgi:hypothetical protein
VAELTLAVAVFVFLFDFQNVLAWWRGWVLDLAERGCDDFTVVIPLFGDPRYFEGRSGLDHVKQNALVSVQVRNAPLMADFADQLEHEGWRVHRAAVSQPSPPTLFISALDSGMIDTSYVVRMDADTVVRPGELPRGVEAVRSSDADICSVKVRVRSPRTLAERLQACEYDMAMLSRHFRPWLTSGACFIGRTEPAREVFRRHSKWFPGEDIETGRVAHALRMRVRHLDMQVETAAPTSFTGLFRQRRLWWAGSFRHLVVNFDRNVLHMPMWTIYYIGLVWCAAAFRLWSLVSWATLRQDIAYLPLTLLLYAAIVFIANFKVRSRWMLVMPAYCLVQSLLMPTVGTVWYFVCARRQRSIGRYRIGLLRRRVTFDTAPVAR